MADHGLVCIGNLTIDEAVQPDGTRVEALGGDAVFAALAARRNGEPARWLAPIGNDLPPGLDAALVAAGLPTGDQPRRDLPTVRNVITYRADGTRQWHLQHGEDHFDAMSVHPGDVGPDVLAADGLLVLAMSLGSQLALTPWLRRHSAATIYLDVQEDYIAGNEDALLDLVGCCDVFLPSEIEALALTGAGNAADAARRLAAAGPRCVVVTQAERGCLVLADEQLHEMPAAVVDPVDPTGAGDAFCGAFATVHLAGGTPLQAAAAGAAAARVAVSGYGVDALLATAPGARP